MSHKKILTKTVLFDFLQNSKYTYFFPKVAFGVILQIERFQDSNFRLKMNEKIVGYRLTLLMKDQSKMVNVIWLGGARL